jgi:dTDP-4-amino-4,6-dideoxygalactose transaminase
LFSGASVLCSEAYVEKAFDKSRFRPAERLLNAKELSETSLMFLVHPTLTEREVSQPCKATEQVMELAS